MINMKRIVDHSWFVPAEFICITLALMLWSNFPALSWQPLLVSITPILLRIAARRSPLKRTPFDIPIVIFLLTAGIGVWVAYQPANAWIKFWLLLTSILFYYHLSRQSADNLWLAAGILCLMGFGIGIFFFLSNNWEGQPQKFQLLSQIGMAWMRIRPNLNLEAMHPNYIAGIAVLSFPFSIALTLKYCRRKSVAGSLLFGVMTGLILVTILLSESRGAWLAVGATAGLWLLWKMIGWLSHRLPVSRRLLYILSLGLLVCLAVGYIWTALHGTLNQIAIGEAGVSISDQRFHLFWSAVELIKDVPFTGGSLDGFSGLYSSYIVINPNYIIRFSHNIFLDASLEQGILGGLMLCWIYLGSILWLALRPVPVVHSLLRKAVLSSLLIIIFHGLVDNIVYDTMSAPLLFFVPGMAGGLAASSNPIPEGFRWVRPRLARFFAPALIIMGVMVIGLIAFRRPLLSAWYTNLGAVEMAKVELSDFPTGVWDEGQHVELLSRAETLFNRALSFEPANPRAHYRLGLIAMLKRDFSTAVGHLEIAHRGDPYHRGMLKALGLSYLWDGQVNAAMPLLSLIPESNQELAVYPWWWRSLNRPDLAAYAEQYLEMAESEPEQ
jgi:O-antigen ligase